jgi:acyl carrier protein
LSSQVRVPLNSDTRDRVLAVLVQHIDGDGENLLPGAALGGDLGMDSLDVTQLAIDIEDRIFEGLFEFPVGEERTWRTIGDVIRSTQNRLESRAAKSWR